MKLAFLGAGKMATALAGGIVGRNITERDLIIASDVSESARGSFSGATGIRCATDNATAIAGAHAVFLAVKPQVAEQVLRALPAGCLDTAVLISIAAGIPIHRLAEWSGAPRIIRVMPNTPSLIGRGASAFAAGPGASLADKELARQLLGAVGVVHEVSEELIDTVTGVSGSGPAYVFEFIQALIDAGVRQGLSLPIATDLVLETMAGAAEMARQRIDSPENLRIAVTSPGGTTAAGLKVFTDGNFRGLVDAVVDAAVKRAHELGG